MLVKLCNLSDLEEGAMLPVGIGYTLVLVVWPTGSAPRALQGICPHAGHLLMDARFDGRNLTCRAHDWVFDATNGLCTVGGLCTLVEYPSQIQDNELFADLDVVPNKLYR